MKSPVFFTFSFMLCVSTITSIMQRSVSLQETNMKRFTEPGVSNYTTMLIREDLGQLFVGASGVVFSLDLANISSKTSEVHWTVTPDEEEYCLENEKVSEGKCLNLIKSLHTRQDGKMLVCGTNALNPTCHSMTFSSNGSLTLDDQSEMGDNKGPFDTAQRHVSMVVGNTFYWAATNIMGSGFQRNGPNPLRTVKQWFNQPTFASMSLIETGKNVDNGEDDQVFLFFVEKAVEEHGALVSRVARVCKGDMGGHQTLRNTWTSFLKARLDCPLGEPGQPSLVQDVFLLQDEHDWRDSILFGVFTSRSESSATSAVCAYKLSDVSQAFSGRFLTRQQVGSGTEWVPHTGQVPFPRPGSCIDNAARDMGINSSLDLPKQTLRFLKNHPLMEEVVRPLTGRPLLLQRGIHFSSIVVDRVTSLNGEDHHVMFIGTDTGRLQTVVQLNGEDGRIVEERQLFETSQPVDVLKLSSRTGQLYAGSDAGVVQVDIRDCSRYTSCTDCVLARVPYCGWDLVEGRCALVNGSLYESMVQRLKDGNVTKCPTPEMEAVTRPFTIGDSQFLPCSRDTNLPVIWYQNGSILLPGPRVTVLWDGLLIKRTTHSDAGHYACKTVAYVKDMTHQTTEAEYLLQLEVHWDTILLVAVGVLCFLLVLVTGAFSCILCIKNRVQERHQNTDGCITTTTNNNSCVVTMETGAQYEPVMNNNSCVVTMETGSQCEPVMNNNSCVVTMETGSQCEPVMNNGSCVVTMETGSQCEPVMNNGSCVVTMETGSQCEPVMNNGSCVVIMETYQPVSYDDICVVT